MRTRLAGAIAATAIAAAALVGCSPPNENPSDIKVTDQENPTHSFEAPEPSDGTGEAGTTATTFTTITETTAETTAPAVN